MVETGTICGLGMTRIREQNEGRKSLEFARYRALPKKGRIVEIRLEVDFHFFVCTCDGALITQY